jgi:polar amino acid transport system substrate-binding protein
MTRVASLLALLLLLVNGCAACAQSLPQRYCETGEIRWGADAEGGAPFVFVDPNDPRGGEVGFEVDLATELGRVLGVRFR